jgi:hypothetical protein
MSTARFEQPVLLPVAVPPSVGVSPVSHPLQLMRMSPSHVLISVAPVVCMELEKELSIWN